MSEKLKSYLLKYGIGTLAGLAAVALTMFGFDYEGASQKDIICCWSDAFTVTGALMILVALLLWVTNHGAFHGIGYSLSMAGKSLIPGGRLGEMETYADYIERKKKKNVKGYGFLYILGAVFLAVGMVFLLIFNNM